MKRVIIESPYAGDVDRNLRYLRACMKDCLERGEAPFASHALYTQPGVLDDLVPDERQKGIVAGYAWWEAAQAVVFYVDLGISPGMQRALEEYLRPVPDVKQPPPAELRRLGGEWAA